MDCARRGRARSFREKGAGQGCSKRRPAGDLPGMRYCAARARAVLGLWCHLITEHRRSRPEKLGGVLGNSCFKRERASHGLDAHALAVRFVDGATGRKGRPAQAIHESRKALARATEYPPRPRQGQPQQPIRHAPLDRNKSIRSTKRTSTEHHVHVTISSVYSSARFTRNCVVGNQTETQPEARQKGPTGQHS